MSNSADRIALLSTFARIADLGSLSGAARSLGVSQASVSRQLAALEARLGAALARRSTHDLTLTPAGAALLPRARALLADWEAMAESLGPGDGPPAGLLRIVAPSGLGPAIVAPAAAEFARRHPAVSIDVLLGDGPIDLRSVGADLLLRVGPVEGQDLTVRKIGTVRRWLVAAPALAADCLDAGGDPRDGLPLVVLRPDYDAHFNLSDAGWRSLTVRCEARVRTDNLAAAYAAVKAGGGAGILPDWLVRDDIEAGRLLRIAEPLEAPSLPIHLAFPPGRFRPARARLFAEALEAKLSPA